MSTDVVKYAFIAGEISPNLFGRTDLTKYDLAVARAQNYFVDYRGGLSTRPGLEFGDFIKRDDLDTRLVPFNFAPDLSNNYVLLFGHNYVRFIQDNAYVLDAAKTITGITQANPAVVTSAAHGLTNGTWVKLSGIVGMTQLNGKTFEVANATANTFSLKSVPDIADVNSTGYTAYTSGGEASPIYEVATSYASTDLAGLSCKQYRDLVRITSNDFPITNLVRNDHTDWVLEAEEISPYYTGPTISSSSASAVGAAATVFAVTRVTDDGTESVHGNKYSVTGVVNYPATEGSISINWSAIADTAYYNVYRSIVSVTETLTRGVELGYVGRTTGTKFTDPNIIPDFSKSPPFNRNPFEPGAIESITITNGGAGYPVFSTSISISDPTGTGFEGEVIVSSSGAIVNILIKSQGKNYTNPTVSFSGGGAGATATATARLTTGTYPALSEIYQQRQIYAASYNRPITLWGSKIKNFVNFNESEIVADNESFEFDLDTSAIAPIKHLIGTRGGLLAMTQENVWLLNGGASNEAITPSNALAELQTYNGVSNVPPIQVDTDLVYVEGKGFAVRVLSYSDTSKVYSGDDRSILSTHLFGEGKEITGWAYQESPFKTIWAVRADGALLSFTIVKAEEVFAWTPCSTRGKFVDVITLRENTYDRVYVVTQRFINNRWTKFFERMHLRQFTNVEDAWCVDAGLALTGTPQSGTVTFYHDLDDDIWTAKTSAAVLTGGTGKYIRAANGVFKITSVTSSTEAVLELIETPTNWIPETGDTVTFAETAWTLDTPTSTLSGLWHLEGETVAVLADGNVFPRQVVANGSITLSQPVTRAIVGLPYTCIGKTLPTIVPDAGIEARRKRVTSLAIRLDKSRGLKAGYDLDHLYEIKSRSTEPYGHPIKLINGVRYVSVSTSWQSDSQSYFVVEDPLPATLLSLVLDMEVGDEPD